jgi:hypothetical protein
MLYSFCHTYTIVAIMTDVFIVFTVCPGNASCYLLDDYLLTAVIFSLYLTLTFQLKHIIM